MHNNNKQDNRHFCDKAFPQDMPHSLYARIKLLNKKLHCLKFHKAKLQEEQINYCPHNEIYLEELALLNKRIGSIKNILKATQEKLTNKKI